MSRHRTLVIFAVAPEGAEGLRARHVGAAGWQVERHDRHVWSGAPADRANELAAFLRELAGPASRKPAAVALLHPQATVCAHAEIPNADARAVGEFLALWAERRWPAAAHGTLRTAWRRIPAEHGKARALVAATREEQAVVIERACAAANLSLLAIAPAADCLARTAHAAEPKKDGIVLELEPAGATVLQVVAGQTVDFAWFPANERADAPASRHALAGFHVAEHRTHHADAMLLLAGQDAARVAESFPGVDAAAANGWARSWREGIGVVDEKAFENIGPALGGALKAATQGRHDWMSFVTRPSPGASLRRLALSRRGALVAVAVLATLIVLWMAAGQLEQRLRDSAQTRAATITVDLEATDGNLRLLADLEGKRRDVVGILLELGELRPDGTLIEEFQIDTRGNFTLGGKAPSFATVEQFVVRLNGSRTFRQVVTQSTVRQDQTIKFAVRGRLGGA
ncbi:MAG: PilN domain-containing protein [Candidatus Sumerlaeia bacterium]|nr:PilN domain-containing protein [Candidatus Sumerlaeia bacterium]